MGSNVSTLRQSVQTGIGRLLPPVMAVPLRSLFGGSREPELKVLATFIRKGDTVIDIGAHRGVYTFRMVRLVGPRGHVVAYEPQPEMVRYLARAGRRGAMHRVDLRARALSDEAGEAVLSVPVHDGVRVVGQATLRDVGAEAADVHLVPVAVLDDEQMPGRVTFIKIDVEGHELALIQGARKLLAKDRPTLLIEVEVRHAGQRVTQLADLLLDDLGYTAFELDGVRLVPVDRGRWDGSALNGQPGDSYVNNFIFRP